MLRSRGMREPPWIFRTYAGHSSAADSNKLFRSNLAKGQTGLSVAFDLPTQTGHRRRSSAGARRSGQGRRADRSYGRHAQPVRRHSARSHEHLHDDQRHGGLAARPLRGSSPTSRGSTGGAGRHHAERHRQGISVARHLCLSARAVAEADARHHSLRGPPSAEMEPDERLFLPSAGGRGDDGAGACLRAGDGDRRPRSASASRRNRAGAVPADRRPHELLRQRRPQAHRRSLQDARLRRAVGRAVP